MKNLILKTDEELINLFRKTQNESFFVVLYDRYKIQLSKYILAISPKLVDEDIFDIIHEVFIKVFTKIDTIKDKKKFSSWLLVITKNTLFEKFRKKSIKTASFDNSLKNLLTDEKSLPEIYLKDLELYRIIDEFTKTLSVEDKEIFNLRALQQLRIDEVAKRTHNKNYQIKYKLKKILKNLKLYAKKHRFYI